MKRNKKQNKSLYITILLILVCVAGVVAFGTAMGEDEKKAPSHTYETEANDTGDIAEKPSDTEEDTSYESVSETQANDEITDFVPESEDAAEDVNEEIPVIAEASESEDAPASEPVPQEETTPVFSSPVSGVVINEYSDTVPVFSETMNDYRTHAGVDVSGEAGEAVLAAADGVVGAVWEDPLMGTCMTVVHDAGFVTTYKGLYPTIPDGIAKGVSVKGGEPIAAVGETALIEVAEEPHVHFEMTQNGAEVDPCLYVTFAAEESYSE